MGRENLVSRPPVTDAGSSFWDRLAKIEERSPQPAVDPVSWDWILYGEEGEPVVRESAFRGDETPLQRWFRRVRRSR